jgi:hypothetical protein
MRKESLVPVFAAVALLGALALAFVWFVGRSPDTELVPPALTSPDDVVANPSDSGGAGGDTGSGREVLVWVDGWSQRTVGRDDVTVVARTARGTQLATVTATLTPASSDDVAELAARDPQTLTHLMARMVRFDTELDCGPQGCTSQRGPVPLDWLTDPSQVPSLGEVYVGWGVTDGLWLARVRVPQDTGQVQVGFTGWAPAGWVLPVAVGDDFFDALLDDDGDSAAGDEPAVLEDDDLLAGIAPSPGASPSRPDAETVTAPLPAADVAVAAAFGVVFPLTPNWVNPDGMWAKLPYAVVPTAEPASASLPARWADTTLLWRGLATVVPELSGAAPSMLTMLSSPTIGCNGALCVPGVADATFAVAASFEARVCPHPEFPEYSGLVGEDAFGRVRVSEFVVSVRLDHPIRQMGSAVVPVSSWPGHVAEGVGPLTGDMPLLSGGVELPVVQAVVFAGDGPVPHMVHTRNGGDAPTVTPSDWVGSWWQRVECR